MNVLTAGISQARDHASDGFLLANDDAAARRSRLHHPRRPVRRTMNTSASLPRASLLALLAACAPLEAELTPAADVPDDAPRAAQPREDAARGEAVAAPVPDEDVLEDAFEPVHADADAEYLDDPSLEPPAAPPPHAAPVSCGAVLTRSTRLREDLGPCPGDGLVIGTDDITLDCAGHRIIGTDDDNGVVLDGRASVNVRNCRIEGFATGISMHGTIGNTVTGNTLVSAEYGSGIEARDGVGDVVGRNRFVGQAARLDSNVLTFAENKARGETPYGTSVFCYGNAAGLRVRDNDLEGFVVLASTNGARVDHNRMRGGGLGFELEGARGTRIDHNVVRDGDVGIVALSAMSSLFEDNDVRGMDRSGVVVLGGSARNLFRDNRADDNGEVGFYVLQGATLNAFDDNEACGNEDVDLLVDGVTGNRFVDNDFCTERFE